MPRNDSLETGELTDTTFYILLTLFEPKHGYLIMKSIETMTDFQVSVGPASLYTIIKKLVSAKLIDMCDDEDDKRKTYRINNKGIEFLENEISRRKDMIRYADEILKQRGDKK